MESISDEVFAGNTPTAGLAWLGRIPDWLRYVPGDPNAGRPTTWTLVDRNKLRAPGWETQKKVIAAIGVMTEGRDYAALSVMALHAAILGDGPKVFRPTDEQWEAMENVELNLPITDFRMPYPAMAVEVPVASRNRLAAARGLPPGAQGRYVYLRLAGAGGPHPTVVTHTGKHGTNQEIFYLFQHGPLNPTIEDALNRDAGHSPDADDAPGLFDYGLVCTRAAMNLCMMLCHFGSRLNPGPRPRNRAERRARELHGASWSTVELSQTVTVRGAARTRTHNPAGHGVGTQPRPHWVRGHWRAYPGRAAERAAGLPVPLLFVQPYRVNWEGVTGDPSGAVVTYEGRR